MKRVLVVLAPGYEEIETTTVVDILRRGGARLTIAGTQAGLLEGSRGLRLAADASLDEVLNEDFDLIVLPGGQPGTDNLNADPRVQTLIQRQDREGKLIAAICAAPIILHSAGLLNDRTITSHPSVKDHLVGVRYSEDRVVIDAHIITSRSPGTALEFSLALVGILFGPDRVQSINNGVMARI